MIRFVIIFILSCMLFFPEEVQGWVAGPGLIAVKENENFRTAEIRNGQTTVAFPRYKGNNEIFHQAFNDLIEKELTGYMEAVKRGEKKRNIAGWVTWQQGRTRDVYSIIFVKSLTYEGGAHPMTYIKGVTWNRDGKRITFHDLKEHVKNLTIENLRTAVAVQCEQKGIHLYSDYRIDDFPKEFYIGHDGKVYFIFQEYEIAPYAAGWIIISMGKYQ